MTTEQVLARLEPPEVKHVTQKGKMLHGVVVDMPIDGIKQHVDPFAFKKNGGVFVSKEHAEKLLVQLLEAGKASVSQPVLVAKGNMSLSGAPATESISVQDARAIVDRLTSGFDRRMRDRVHVLATTDELPTKIKQWLGDAVNESEHDIPAVYWAGNTYIVAENTVRRSHGRRPAKQAEDDVVFDQAARGRAGGQ